jgi:hypothetical protein
LAKVEALANEGLLREAVHRMVHGEVESSRATNSYIKYKFTLSNSTSLIVKLVEEFTLSLPKGPGIYTLLLSVLLY